MERRDGLLASKMTSYDYLKHALFRLMRVQSVQRITVKALCAEAHLNRSTFYANFSGMEAFLDVVMHDIADGLPKIVSNFGRDKNLLLRKGKAYECYRQWFRYVDENREAFQLLTGKNGPQEFRTILDDQGIRWYRDLLRPLLPRFEARISLDALAIYIVSAHQGLMMWYLNGGQKYSADYMAEQLVLLTFEGSFSLLHLFIE